MSKLSSDQFLEFIQEHERAVVLFYSHLNKNYSYLEIFDDLAGVYEEDYLKFAEMNCDENEIPKITLLSSIYFFSKNKKPYRYEGKLNKIDLTVFLDNLEEQRS